MATIKHIEGLTIEQIQEEVNRGGKFVTFEYCISILVMTFKHPTDIYFIRADESAFVKGLPYSLISLLLGWWGIPWGPIYTIWSLVTNIRGGEDLTIQVMESFEQQTAWHS
ncbi:MAG: hypothetical protein SF053_01940 [Bacteroidia bacterium]|nr:hypothetical protein [Bacteroidia bacterium]